MDVGRLRKIDDTRWTVPLASHETRAPVILFGTESLLSTMDDKVLEQILNTSRLPGIVGPAVTMPDAHWGYGFPIGGVAAFDADEGGVISAGGVGFDISCGIRSLRTPLTSKQIEPVIGELSEALFRAIPAGVGEPGHHPVTLKELDQIMKGGAGWAVRNGFGTESDLSRSEENGTMEGANPSAVSDKAKERQRNEMGTLGSGNHYLEIQVVEHLEDSRTAAMFGLFPDQVLISIHCGSRGFGHQIGTDYLLRFVKEAPKHNIQFPDRELAYAPIRSALGQEYIGAMKSAINVALANRQILTHLAREVFKRFFGDLSIETVYDLSHNTCKEEVHLYEGKKRRLWVHRKGATRAFGPGHPALSPPFLETGQPVFIGGSMGTGSYILAGTPESEALSFSSASHGAGRAMSRHEALKHWNGRSLVQDLKAKGIVIRSRSMRGVAEEAPGAYKSIEEVGRATELAGLAKRVAYLVPKICVKG